MRVRGGVGNQMFQYAFLRMQANRLKTKYACPKLDIDTIFDLSDNQRIISDLCEIPIGFCSQTAFEPGYFAGCEKTTDNFSFVGYFESPKHFPNNEPKEWFSRFRKTYADSLIDKGDAIAMVKTFGSSYNQTSKISNTCPYPEIGLEYYKNALKVVGDGKLVVFSDYPENARAFFGSLSSDIYYVEHIGIDSDFNNASVNNDDVLDDIARQLYLMTRCRDFVLPTSTFAWWGAYLGANANKRVVSPDPWFKPSETRSPKNPDIYCEDWVRMAYA